MFDLCHMSIRSLWWKWNTKVHETGHKCRVGPWLQRPKRTEKGFWKTQAWAWSWAEIRFGFVDGWGRGRIAPTPPSPSLPLEALPSSSDPVLPTLVHPPVGISRRGNSKEKCMGAGGYEEYWDFQPGWNKSYERAVCGDVIQLSWSQPMGSSGCWGEDSILWSVGHLWRLLLPLPVSNRVRAKSSSSLGREIC